MKLESIVQYSMSQDEAEAYKLACIYETEYTKTFKSMFDGAAYRQNTLPKRGDPRKSNLFRYCWKLRRETRGLLEGHEYSPYIQANFMIMKINFLKGNKKGNVRVEPNAICGNKAWYRWKLVKRWKKEKAEETEAAAPKLPVSKANRKTIKELILTKKFLFEKFEGEPSFEKLKSFYDQGFFKIWVMGGLVSKVYIMLSPFVENLCDSKTFMDECGFDPLITQEKLTDEVKEYFDGEFEYELHSGRSAK